MTKPPVVPCFVHRKWFKSLHCLRCLSALELCFSSQPAIWNENAGNHRLERALLTTIVLWEERELLPQVIIKQLNGLIQVFSVCNLQNLSTYIVEPAKICQSTKIHRHELLSPKVGCIFILSLHRMYCLRAIKC